MNHDLFFHVLLVKRHKRSARLDVVWFDFYDLHSRDGSARRPLGSDASLVAREQRRLWGVPGGQNFCNSDEQTGQSLRRKISLGEGARRGSSRQPLPVDLRGAPEGFPLPSDSHQLPKFSEGSDSTAKPTGFLQMPDARQWPRGPARRAC